MTMAITEVLKTRYKKTISFRTSHWSCSLRKGIKKETLAQVFSCEFYEISKNIFFTEHLWATASVRLVLFITSTELVGV